MPEETKKEGFFKKIIKSIKDFDKYEDFALEKPREAIKYLLKIILIFAAVIGVVYTYKVLDTMNKVYAGMKDKFPEFSYENGNLSTDPKDPVIIEDYGEMIGTIIVDTEIEPENIENEYKKDIDKYGSAFIFLKDKIVIHNPRLEGQVAYRYSDLLGGYGLSQFTKQEVVETVDNLNIVSIAFSVYIMMFIYLFIIYVITIIIDVVILSLLAYITGRITGIKLKSAPAFNVAVHSITLPVFLNLIYMVVNILTGFEIRYFQIMYNIISYIYVVVAILMIKTDFINRQIELMKLAKEQEKIKREMEEQKEEKEENNEEDHQTESKNNEPTEKEEKSEETPNKKKRKKKDSSETDPVGDVGIVSDEK